MKKLLFKKLFWSGLFITNLYAIGYVWIIGSADLIRGDVADILIAYGRLGGLLLQYLILVELVLVSRFEPLEQLYGFDKQNTLHRRIGYALVGFLFLHPLLLSWGYGIRADRSIVEQFVGFVTSWEDVLPATIGTLVILVAGILSIPKIRSYLTYEVWYFGHLPMYLGVALAFGHQTASGDVAFGGAMRYWLILNVAVFGVILVYRLMVPIFKNWKHRFRVSRVVRESPNVVSVYLTGRRMRSFHFVAGQWARVIFFQKGMWHGPPFSFSAPYDGKELRFSIKALGDWTARAEELCPGTRVWLEGPLGTFTLAQGRTNKQLFIAGGIGITPILAMVRSLSRKAGAFLCYAARTRTDLVFTREVAKSGVRHVYILSGEVCDGYETGYVTLERLRHHCPDLADRDVYLCGPPAMLNALLPALRAAGVSEERLHHERFGM